MAIRTVTWTVGSDGTTVTPITPQNGGVQGEENATMVVFRFGEESPLADSALQLYIECMDNAGGYDKTPPLTVEDGQVRVLVPLAWTQYGGISTLRLVGERDGNILYTLEGRLRFASRQTAARQVDGLLRTHIQQTLNEVETAAVTAEVSAEQAAASAAAAEIAEETAEAARRASSEAVEKAAQAGQAAASAAESAKAAETLAETLASIDDDAVTYAHPWSSKNTVDKLCKFFTLTGETVVCHPVEHYPLGVTAAIEPLQEGSGDPSPENVRPISGWDSIVVTHNDTAYTIPLDETVYGGSLDVTGGMLTIDRALATFDGSEDEGWAISVNNEKNFQAQAKALSGLVKNQGGGLSDKYLVFGKMPYNQSVPYIRASNTMWYEGVVGSFADIDAFKAYLAENPFTVCYYLAEPITVQLDQVEILAQGGSNTLYADSGTVTVTGRETPLPAADNVGKVVGVSVDSSLTRSGYAADAAATGRRLLAAEKRLDAAEAAQVEAKERLDSAETAQAAATQRMDAAETAQVAATQRMDAVETAQVAATQRLESAENSIATLNAANTDLALSCTCTAENGKLTVVLDKFSDHQGGLLLIKGRSNAAGWSRSFVCVGAVVYRGTVLGNRELGINASAYSFAGNSNDGLTLTITGDFTAGETYKAKAKIVGGGLNFA